MEERDEDANKQVSAISSRSNQAEKKDLEPNERFLSW